MCIATVDDLASAVIVFNDQLIVLLGLCGIDTPQIYVPGKTIDNDIINNPPREDKSMFTGPGQSQMVLIRFQPSQAGTLVRLMLNTGEHQVPIGGMTAPAPQLSVA